MRLGKGGSAWRRAVRGVRCSTQLWASSASIYQIWYENVRSQRRCLVSLNR